MSEDRQRQLWRKNSRNYYWRHQSRVNERKRELSKIHPRDYVPSDLKRNYGITVEEYIKLWESQNGLCAICGKPESALAFHGKRRRKLCVDHCHETKKVRGLLCASCNIGIGNLKNDISLLKKAAAYLEKHIA